MRLFSTYVYKSWLLRMVIGCVDALGYLLFWPLRLFQPPRDLPGIKKVLAIRLDHIGDVVMTRPALEALHEQFPQWEIDLLVSQEAAPLFEDAREIRKTVIFSRHWFAETGSWFQKLAEAKKIIGLLRRKKYDLAIDFRGDLRNILMMVFAGIPKRIGYGITGGGFLLTDEGVYSRRKHQVLLNLELLENLGVESEATEVQPLVYSGARKKEFWNRFAGTFGETSLPRIVIHPGAGYPSKRWASSKFRELIKKVNEKGLGQVILIGTEKEKKLFGPLDLDQNPIIDLRGKTALAELPILFDACDLFVGNDSGPAHLAAAQGMEMIVIASGTNDIQAWHPWSERLHLVSHTVPCSPCEARECPLRHHDCMEKITAEEIFQKVKAIMHHSRSLETNPCHEGRK